MRVHAQPLGWSSSPVTFTRAVHRREDFLALEFEFHNLRLDRSNPRKLVKKSIAFPAFLVVVLPPQHLADEAFTEVQPVPSPGDARTRLAGPSRLAFEVPSNRLPMPFNLETLLDWVKLSPRLVPAASAPLSPGIIPTIRAPEPTETALELPWFLVLSPLSPGGWAHAQGPVTHNDRTELWHTRLGKRSGSSVDEDDAGARVVQAVFARDPKNPPAEPTLSLTPDNRRQIVRLSSDRSLGSARRPVEVDRLMLSSLGGWLDCHGSWPEVEGFSVADWRHRASMGRDSYVKVVDRGFLFPYGHQAASISVTERRFRSVKGGKQRAYLAKRQFVIVRQPLRDYGGVGHPSDGRAFPFRSVRITTLITPDIQLEEGGIFVPRVLASGDPVLFDLVGVDWSGRETELDSPLTFVRADVKQNALASLTFGYNAKAPDDEATQRRRPVGGQKIAFAEEEQAGDTSFDVTHMLIGAQEALESKVNQLRKRGEATFFPLLQQTGLRLPAAEQLAGKLLGETLMELDPGFIKDGFDEVLNAGQVFLKMADSAPDLLLSFVDQADKAGGIATPDLSISGITRQLGPVGGLLDDLRKGDFDPATYLNQAAKLLGATKLLDILDKVPLGQGGATAGPRIQTILEPKPPGLPQRIITTLDWEPKLNPKGDPLRIFVPRKGSKLELNVRLVTDLVAPDDSTFEVKGDLRNFDLNLIGDGSTLFMIAEVKQLRFTAVPDKKPDIDLELGEITFAGVLQFVEEFKNFLSSLGKGLAIDVSPKGIEASLSLPLPRISVGVFTLQNLSILLGTTIPFNGDAARFRFYFCTRENPFLLSISMFGGGGFFGIECGTDKSVFLEVSLEFGASVAFDIGVASGGVEVMAGIYIEVQDPPGMASLTGFLRMGGELSILGIISISCELYLGFKHDPLTDKCIGQAKFFLEIEIFIFSTTIDTVVERRFGGESDPTFAQLMAPPAWTEYCNAYAPIGAP